MKTREKGKREALRVVLPVNISNIPERAILETLQSEIAHQFGGFTVTFGQGGWIDGAALLTEHNAILEVSYVKNSFNRGYAIRAFEKAGRALGQEWLHIERRTFRAEHRKLSGLNEYNNA